MDVNVNGFDELERNCEELQELIRSLEGEVTTVRVDPAEPQSIERAVQQMEQAVDRKLIDYQHNPLIAEFLERAKARFREQILMRSRVG